jgi:aryl-alcohol dehydrogenase-like predicted oxidoreductase
VFKALEDLRRKGKIRYYGVSVEKISEALRAVEYPDVQSVQIIFNMLRLRPATDFFPTAKRRKVGILARVPLASGLLTGKITAQTQFPDDDHRNYNRNGESFDKGETFSGVDFDQGLVAVSALKKLIPPGMTMAQFALRWILMFDTVTCAIPGAKTPEQVNENLTAATAPALDGQVMDEVRSIYDRLVRPGVHAKW